MCGFLNYVQSIQLESSSRDIWKIIKAKFQFYFYPIETEKLKTHPYEAFVLELQTNGPAVQTSELTA